MSRSVKLYNIDIEKNLIAGLLKYGNEVYDEIRLSVKPNHFFNESSLHKTIYYIIGKCLDSNEDLDEVLIADKISNIGASFSGVVDIVDYLKNLKQRVVSIGSSVESARQIVLYFVRRELCFLSDEIKESVTTPKEDIGDFDSIISRVDTIYNNKISGFEFDSDDVVNIYDKIEEVIEGIEEGVDEAPKGPFPRLYQCFGSLYSAGNITVIAARSGVGKTMLAMHASTAVSAETGCTVIHFDNGEMSLEELIIRQTASLSGVPEYAIKSGKWRRMGKEVVEKVRAVYKRVKGMKFYYVPVGGLSHREMIIKFRREYYSKVGRGNYCLFSFDYIKTSSEKSNKRENELVGDMMDAFKTMIKDELKFDGKPMVGMITSVQSNRVGIVGKKTSSEVIEDSSTVSLSDRIEQISSHLFILRYLSLDERAEMDDQWGTHVLIPVKKRHLGEDVSRALTLVKVDGKAPMENRFFLNFNNFNIKEVGDYVDYSESIDINGNIEETDSKGGKDPCPI